MLETNGITFGPVPSRRLGRSLGINNIPPKTCSYACIYCQVEKTTHLSIPIRPPQEESVQPAKAEKLIGTGKDFIGNY